MKTISNNNRNFPKPFRFAIYVVAVTIVGFMNWMAISANDPVMESSLKLESRLAEALAPAEDPEYELEDWILTLSEDILSAEMD